MKDNLNKARECFNNAQILRECRWQCDRRDIPLSLACDYYEKALVDAFDAGAAWLHSRYNVMENDYPNKEEYLKKS